MTGSSLGQISLYASFALLVAATGLFAWGAMSRRRAPVEYGRMALLGALAFTVVASAFLMAAFLNDDFSLQYVADRSSRATPLIYKIGAFWGGQGGSLLLWQLVLGIYSAVAALSRDPDTGRFKPISLAILASIGSFFSLLTAFVATPFLRANPIPVDGAGLNPLLQDVSMMLHPLALYAGYVGFSVPFAYGFGALLARETGPAWIRTTRRSTLVAWTFLSLGIMFGGNWAYHELGWGGYWGWDPVENSSLVPWLTATAFVHSSIVQDRRGMLKQWNAWLVLITYFLTVFGTFVTRSGILASIHAFAESDVGPYFIAYLGALLAFGIWAILARQEELRDERRLESYVSKEASFLLNNIALGASAFAVFLGTVLPLVTRLFGVELTVGTPYYERVNGPLFWLTVVLMGIGPLLAWRRARLDHLRRHLLWPAVAMLLVVGLLLVFGVREGSALIGLSAAVLAAGAVVSEVAQGVAARRRLTGEGPLASVARLVTRSPGKYGGYVVHLGLAVMAAGIVVSRAYQVEVTRALRPNQPLEIGNYTFTYTRLMERQEMGVPAVAAVVRVERDGRFLTEMTPSKRFYPRIVDKQGPQTEVAIARRPGQDLYIVLAGWEPDGSLAAFQIYLSPLIGWIWYGAYIFLAGAFVALWPWPQPESERASSRVYSALAELEYDFQMGKLTLATYQAIRADLVAEASRVEQALAEAERRVRLELAGLAPPLGAGSASSGGGGS